MAATGDARRRDPRWARRARPDLQDGLEALAERASWPALIPGKAVLAAFLHAMPLQNRPNTRHLQSFYIQAWSRPPTELESIVQRIVAEVRRRRLG
jgi:hypothetical protein